MAGLAGNTRRLRRVLVTTGKVLLVLVVLYGFYVVNYPSLYDRLNGHGGNLNAPIPARFPIPAPWPLQPYATPKPFPVNK